MKLVTAAFCLVFCAQMASATSLRCNRRHEDGTPRFAFLAPGYSEKSDFRAAVTETGAFDSGDRLEAKFTSETRFGYLHFEGTSSNGNHSGFKLWINPSYAKENGTFPGQIDFTPGPTFELVCVKR